MGDEIAGVLLDAFNALPKRGKPAADTEWTVLAGVVLVSSRTGERSRVAALATGQKCLSAREAARSNGRWVLDCHAETLAMRGFSKFVIQRRRDKEFFTFEKEKSVWRRHWAIHLVVTEIPCGDASMESTMARQSDATPWETPRKASGGSMIRGRAFFGELGRVRSKPGRADAEPTTSKSCTDKLLLGALSSVLRGPALLHIAPEGMQLTSLVLPTLTAAEKLGVQRAFVERLASCPNGFRIQESALLADFAHRRSSGRISSSVSIVHVDGIGTEFLARGRKQGCGPASPKSQSYISKRALWHDAVAASDGLQPEKTITYREWKSANLDRALRTQGRALLGMLSSRIDDGFIL